MARRDEPVARARIINSHQGLVYMWVNKFASRYRLDVEDLVAAGNEGLLTALKLFEVERGWRFSTYAMHWVRAKVDDFVETSGLALSGDKSGRRMTLMREYMRARKAGMSHDESVAEAVAAYARTNTVPVKLATGAAIINAQFFKSVSIASPLGTNNEPYNDFTLGDTLAGADDVEATVMDVELRQRVRERVAPIRQTLTPVFCAILDQRLLANDEDRRTLEELGDQFNVSRERIRQLECQLVTRLQKALQEVAHEWL